MIDPFLPALLAVALGASLLSIRLGVSVAILEMAAGMALAPLLPPGDHPWLPFLAGLGSLMLSFLAGAEIDPGDFRARWRESLVIGALSFAAPLVAVWALCAGVLGWDPRASLLAGVALSATSVAVVYVVLVESGLTGSPPGKLILSSCFVTGLGTLTALSLLFHPPNPWILASFGALGAAALGLPRLLERLFAGLREGAGQVEVKAVLLLVLLLAFAAEAGGSQGVLPAYIAGLIAARTLQAHRGVLLRLRGLSLALLTPFFFLNAGLGVSLGAVAAGALPVALLFGTKVAAKFAGVLPPARRWLRRDAVYLTLLLSTGLTFDTIASTYGLQESIITRGQYSVLVAAILLTAIVPALVAQRFMPEEGTEGS